MFLNVSGKRVERCFWKMFSNVSDKRVERCFREMFSNISGHQYNHEHAFCQPVLPHLNIQRCLCQMQVKPPQNVINLSQLWKGESVIPLNSMQSMMHAKYPKQLKLTTHNLNRLLSWAAHVFAYDLAYEPEGWPWRPVSHIKYCLLSFVCL